MLVVQMKAYSLPMKQIWIDFNGTRQVGHGIAITFQEKQPLCSSVISCRRVSSTCTSVAVASKQCTEELNPIKYFKLPLPKNLFKLTISTCINLYSRRS